MIKNLFLLFLTLSSSCIFAQKASDYLCLDTTQVLYYRFYTGDTLKLTFDKSFIYETDTICYYTRQFEGQEHKQTVFFAYNGSTLTKGNYIVNSAFNGTNELDTKFEIVNANTTSDTAYTKSFDMQTTEFKQTTRILAEYKHENGNTYVNVLEVDQFNVTDNFHYITLFAPGIGIISRGGKEMELLEIKTK